MSVHVTRPPPGKRPPPYRKVRARRRFVLLSWLLLSAVMVVRAAEVQILERQQWATDALGQHQKSQVVPASRGRILDRNGGELAVTHWRASVGVAPNEIRDREQVVAALVENLGVRARTARRVSDAERSWQVVPGRYSMTQVSRLRGVRGVHVQGELRRLYPREGLARGLLGTVRDGVGAGGVEQAMDSMLAGQAGRETVARDNLGAEIPGQVVAVQEPVAGHDVVLTIDMDLQAIAEEVLSDAVGSAGARGGDLVVTDPVTGEILAMASVRRGAEAVLSAVTTTYEPGSTVKPFTAAALLSHGLAALSDSVDTGQGAWEVAGREITDVHGGGWMTLHEVIQQSSNVGIAKFGERLSRGQQYTSLRDFGFGTPTGVLLPSEAAGLLRRPEQWSGQSSHSLSFGYELAVTPLQMAVAFGVLANGGLLMEPRLIKEVRQPDGSPVHFGRPRVVRRVVAPWVAETLTRVLVDVVENGTGSRARMSSFLVAGKSGTARAVGVGGRYEPGAYHSSFGAYFPADDPQLLFFVKLDRPKGEYYGGATAAPVTRTALESLLSARQSPIDRRALARVQRHYIPPPPTTPLVRFAVAAVEGGPSPFRLASSSGGGVPTSGGVPATIGGRAAGAGPDGVAGAAETSAAAQSMVVPRLEGASMRVAVRRLHKMGLRVRLEGSGAVTRTIPGPGAVVAAGDTVRVRGRGGA